MVSALRSCASHSRHPLLFWLLIGSFLVVTDRRQQPDLQKLAIGLIVTVLGATLTPLRRD